MYNEIPFGM
ncbi:hypothetical protein WFX44_003709 [Escherichia coli]